MQDCDLDHEREDERNESKWLIGGNLLSNSLTIPRRELSPENSQRRWVADVAFGG